MIKLVATDMDGTFLNEHVSYDVERLKRLLDRFDQKGIVFAAASGRGYLSLEKLFAPVKDRIMFIAENGSLVEYKEQVLYEAVMPKEFYLSVYEQLTTSPYVDTSKMLLTGKKGCYVLNTVNPSYLVSTAKFNENIMKVSSLEEIQDDIFKFTLNFEEEETLAGEAWVNEHIAGVSAMTTGFESIDIVLEHVDKGVAITALAEKMGWDMEQIVAFGDNLNDLHMMQVVGLPIAPSNARPEIQELAKIIIGPHSEESVIAYMEELVRD